MPEKFFVASANEIERSTVEATQTPVHDWVGVEGVMVLSDPGNLKSWLVFERNCPDVRFGSNIRAVLISP